MGTYKPDVSNFIGIVKLHNQPVLIAGNVKNNPVPADDTGTAELSFQVVRAPPLSILDDPIPGS